METVEITEAPIPTNILEPLVVADRCDRNCPAQALVRLSKGTMILDLCGHDFAALEASLLGQGFEIQQDVRDSAAIKVSSCSTSS